MRTILMSDLIFTATGERPFKGFVGIKGNKIDKVGRAEDLGDYITENDRVIDLEGKVITPGFVDNHVFFTGYMWERLGFDASGAKSGTELLSLIREEAEKIPGSILGHGLDDNMNPDPRLLNETYPDRPVVIFTESRESCYMNCAAEKAYGFSADECWAEACWKLFEEVLSDQQFAKEQYLAFQQLLASRGVTSIKEIGFDSYSGFTKVLKELEDEDKLKHRINLVSQPVKRGADLEYGEYCAGLFTGDKIRFMGYNIMVDGDIETGDGDLLDEYKDNPGVHCGMDVEYEEIEETVIKADKKGFRCALHAEGDAAVRRSIDIIEKSQEINGKRDHRHAIVDIELIDPTDRLRMCELGITAIEYIQIMNCYPGRDAYWDRRILTEERAKTIWAYHSTINDGVRLCFGTDLPLDVPNIPLSVKFGTKRLFPDGTPKGGYHIEEAITPAQILTCWTKNGQEANFEEERLGTLEAGKLADIAVLDVNVFAEKADRLLSGEVYMTIFDGKVVYRKEDDEIEQV